MPVTLNSPKLADPKSLQFQMWKKQQDRKRRKNPFVPELFERCFRRNEGTTDYATIPEVTLTGDFVIEFGFLTSSTKDLQTLFSHDSTNNEIGCDIQSSGNIRVFNFNAAGSLQTILISPDGGLNDGLFHSVIIELSGLTPSITIDGVKTIGADWVGYDGAKISSLLRRVLAASREFEGILANLKIWDNGTLIRHYKLNDNSDILANSATVLGGELVINSNWTDGSTGSATASIDGVGEFTLTRVDAGNVGRLDQVIATEIGKQYMFTVIKTSADHFAMRVGTSLGVADVLDKNLTLSAPQTSTVIFTATTTTTYINFRSTTNNGISTGNMSSIRQADGYGTVINGNADDWGLFTEQATGEWLGQELITQDVWENPDSVGAQWGFANNQWTMISDGSISALSLLPFGSQPDVMRLIGNIVSIDQNRLATNQSGSIGEGQFDSAGPYAFEWSKAVYGGQQFKRAGGAVTATIDKPSLKEVLNVA